jgi:hypothetical protein
MEEFKPVAMPEVLRAVVGALHATPSMHDENHA